MTVVAASSSSPQSGPRAARLLTGVALAWIVAAAYVLVAVLIPLLILPKFEEIFRDFGVALPRLTQFLLRFARWYSGNSPGQTVPGVLLLLPVHLITIGGCLGFGLMTAIAEASVRRFTRGFLLLVLLMLGMAFVAVIAGLLGPLTAMISSMQNGGSI